MAGRQRNIRKRTEDNNDNDNEDPGTGPSREKIEETRLLQKLRKKTAGMGAEKLAMAGSIVEEEFQEPQTEAESMVKLMDSYVKATTVREADEDIHM